MLKGVCNGSNWVALRVLSAAIAVVSLQFGLVGCGQGGSESASGEPQGSSESANRQGDGAVPDSALLSSLMGADEASKLVQEAQDDPDRAWIASHPEELAMDGDTVQGKLLRLAADEVEAVPYVRDFPQRYPGDYDASAAAATPPYDDTYPSVASGNTRTPHLYQWDQRWGYVVYSSTAFGLTGCGPTAFAMAYQGATGRHDKTPYDMAVLAQQMGFMAEFEGTDPAFFGAASSQLGMSCAGLDLDEASLKSALGQGNVVIANVGNGYFSRFSGHYLVLTGFDENGKLVLNDPYSAAHSRQTWDVDFILGETMALYSFSVA